MAFQVMRLPLTALYVKLVLPEQRSNRNINITFSGFTKPRANPLTAATQPGREPFRTLQRTDRNALNSGYVCASYPANPLG
jgi:hypothetical protein